MDEYLNDTYKIIPEMQKSFYFQKGKIQTFDEFLSQFGERVDEIEKKMEDLEKKLTETNNNKPSDVNMAELLKANMGGDFDNEENTNVVINLITKLEEKINNKQKMTDDRLNKIEENNFKSQKEIQNIKNAQDLNKRNINMLKQSNENMITNLRTMESRIKNKSPEIEQKIEIETKESKIIKKDNKKRERERERKR